jgi:hypothetical protein
MDGLSSYDMEEVEIRSNEWLNLRSVFFIVPDTAAQPFLRYRRGQDMRSEAFIDLGRVFVPTAAPPPPTSEGKVKTAPTTSAESEPADVMAVLAGICGSRFSSVDSFDDPDLIPMVRCVMPEAALPDRQVSLAAFDFVDLTKAAFQRVPNLRYLVVQFTTNTGKRVEGPILTFNVSRRLYKSIDWANMDPEQIARRVAANAGRYDPDDGVFVTPKYEDAWRNFLEQRPSDAPVAEVGSTE